MTDVIYVESGYWPQGYVAYIASADLSPAFDAELNCQGGVIKSFEVASGYWIDPGYHTPEDYYEYRVSQAELTCEAEIATGPIFVTAQAELFCSSEFAAELNTVYSVASNTSSSFTVTAVISHIEGADLTAFGTSTMTTGARVLRGLSSSLASQTQTTATSTRIRPHQAALASTTQVSSTAVKIVSGVINLDDYYIDFGYIDTQYYQGGGAGLFSLSADLTERIGILQQAEANLVVTTTASAEPKRTVGGSSTMVQQTAVTATISHIEGADLFAFSNSQLAIQVDAIKTFNLQTSAVFDIAVDAVRGIYISAQADSDVDLAISYLRRRSTQAALDAALSLAADMQKTATAEAILASTVETSATIKLTRGATASISAVTIQTADTIKVVSPIIAIASDTVSTLTAQATVSNFAILESQTALTALAVKTTTTSSNQNAQTVLSALVQDMTKQTGAVLEATSQQTTDARKSAVAEISLQSISTMTVVAVKAVVNSASLESITSQTTDAIANYSTGSDFDSISIDVSVANKIGRILVDCQTQSTMSVTAKRYAGLTNQDFTGIKAYTGIRTDISGLEYNIDDERQILTQGRTISLWAQRHTATSSGIILSNNVQSWFAGNPFNSYMNNTLRVNSNNSLSFSGYFEGGAGNPNSTWNANWLNAVPADTDWHHYLIWVSRTGLGFGTQVTMRLYRDGQLIQGISPSTGVPINDITVSQSIPSVSSWFTKTFGLGSEVSGHYNPPSGSNLSSSKYQIADDGIRGLEQLWVGVVSDPSTAIARIYNNGFVDLGPTGTQGSGGTLNTPQIYDVFDQPYSDSINPYGAELDVDYVVNTQGWISRATWNILANAGLITDVDLDSTTELAASISLTKPGLASLAVTTELTAEPYDFTKANSSLESTTSLTADAYDFTKAEASLESTTAISTDLGIVKEYSSDLQVNAFSLIVGISAGSVNMDAVATTSLTATANYTVSGESSLASTTELSTLAGFVADGQATLNTDTTLTAEALKVQAGEILVFSQTAQSTAAIKTAQASAGLEVNAFKLVVAAAGRPGLVILDIDTDLACSPARTRGFASAVNSTTQLACTVTQIKQLGAGLTVQSFTLSVGTVTRIDPYYQLIIKPETRYLVINRESRQLEIDPEQREFIINTEDRTIVLDSETRTLLLEGH